MNSTIFWDITLCSPLKVNRRFGKKYRLHLRAEQAEQDTSVKAGGTLLDLFYPEDGGDIFLRNVG
jgi:hypothetical protein